MIERYLGPVLGGLLAVGLFGGALNNLYLWGLWAGLEPGGASPERHQQWFWTYCAFAAGVALVALIWARRIATRPAESTVSRGPGPVSPTAPPT